MLAKFTLNLQLQDQVVTGEDMEASRETGLSLAQAAPGLARFTSLP